MRRFILCFIALICPFFVYTQSLDPQSINHLVDKQLLLALKEHHELVSIPNDAAFPADIDKNITWLKPAFEERGFKVELLKTSNIPIFFAQKNQKGVDKTLLFYFHLDGQSVDPKQWDQKYPWTPVLKAKNNVGVWEEIGYEQLEKGEIDPEWRIYARSAADDKGPIIMFLHALDILKKEKITASYNIKVILDGEEEKGSAGLSNTLEKYKDTYASDYMIIMDGPAHASNRPTLTFGCRGIASCSITVYGPVTSQHSGHYGNFAPNPVFRMAHLLASMKDESGRALVKGFYDGISLEAPIQKLLKAVPNDDKMLQERLQIAEMEKVGNTYQEALQYPSLNVRHIHTSWEGPGLKTIIPDWAKVHIDVRLVPETDKDRQLDLIHAHIHHQGFYVLDREPTKVERLTHPKIATFERNRGVNAFRTDMESPFGQALNQAITTITGETPVRIRIMGGTVPIAPIIGQLDIPAVIVPMVNMDNNQHSPNENLRIGNIIQGIKTCMAILMTEL